MKYDAIFAAIASAVHDAFPGKPVYVDALHADADGAIFIRMVEAAVTDFGNRKRYTPMFEISYYLADGDTFSYNEWLDGIFSALKCISADGKPLQTFDKRARQDIDSRSYQFTFSLDYSLYRILDSERMGDLKTNITEV